MKNNKFIEFITKYEKFYNCLSKMDRKKISDLDNYNELKYYTDNNFYTYMCIGDKNKKYYMFKCTLKYNPETFYMVVDKGRIVVMDDISMLTCIRIMKNFRIFEL